MIIKNGMVFTESGVFKKQDICIEKDCFAEQTSDLTVIDAANLYVIPGLIDIHFHGCAGYDFCDGTEEAIQKMAYYQAKNGITAICPATMTVPDDALEKILKNAASYSEKEHRGADLVGINMEGPYLSEAKKGAQNGKNLKAPNVEHFLHMDKMSNHLIKLVSIAPEVEGAFDFIRALKDKAVISIGHTDCDYETGLKAFLEGASHVTHLYNAMNEMTHRLPGVIGAAFDSKHVKVELICDGIHIHPSVIRAAFRLFGDDRIILISDSMMAADLSDGIYQLGGQKVEVNGHAATLEDGVIAGSVTNLMKCVKNLISFGIPKESAVKCAAVNPAKQIGVFDKYGSISVNKYANALLMDRDFNLISVILKGKLF